MLQRPAYSSGRPSAGRVSEREEELAPPTGSRQARHADLVARRTRPRRQPGPGRVGEGPGPAAQASCGTGTSDSVSHA